MKRMCVVLVALAGVFLPAAPAHAQLPPTPQVPSVDLPEPVADAAVQAIDTVVPIVGQTAIQLRPVATYGGFALRAPCAAVGSTSFVLALGSSVVVTPIPTGVLLGPALIFCSGAFEAGPGDSVFAQIDDATGEAVEGQSATILDQVSGALEPAKPQLDGGCGVVKIFSEAPRQAPPPLHRVDLIGALCS